MNWLSLLLLSSMLRVWRIVCVWWGTCLTSCTPSFRPLSVSVSRAQGGPQPSEIVTLLAAFCTAKRTQRWDSINIQQLHIIIWQTRISALRACPTLTSITSVEKFSLLWHTSDASFFLSDTNKLPTKVPLHLCIIWDIIKWKAEATKCTITGKHKQKISNPFAPFSTLMGLFHFQRLSLQILTSTLWFVHDEGRHRSAASWK